MNPAIHCQELNKAFREKGSRNGTKGGFLRPRPRRSVPAVASLNLQVKKGEIFGIVGPNGSGKSTLVRLISTLLLPDSGRIEVFGLDVVKDRLKVRRMINRVSVDAAFFKKLSCWENLSYAARLYGLPIKEAKQKAVEILRRFGFQEDRISQPMENLSRGMQQMVAITRAYFTSPVLLLLDEPTTGLDPKSKRQVQEFILQVRKDHDSTVLLTTHDMDEAEKVCDRVAIIDRGRFVALDTPTELKRMVTVEGRPVTLEDVFMELTGRDWGEEE
jgi:ABC-2 type transport system ATP-binding protein